MTSIRPGCFSPCQLNVVPHLEQNLRTTPGDDAYSAGVPSVNPNLSTEMGPCRAPAVRAMADDYLLGFVGNGVAYGAAEAAAGGKKNVCVQFPSIWLWPESPNGRLMGADCSGKLE